MKKDFEVRMMRLQHFILLLVCATVIGCSSGGGEGSTDTIEPSTTTASSTANVEVQIKSWEEVEKLVASHQGKVVVMDAWATW